jgi:hypothetical protein
VPPPPQFAPPIPYPYQNPGMPFPRDFMQRPGWPFGWQRPQFPTPPQQRMYMRCSVWPGPGGLVPPVPFPGQPGAPSPFPGVPGGHVQTHHHRRRRR